MRTCGQREAPGSPHRTCYLSDNKWAGRELGRGVGWGDTLEALQQKIPVQRGGGNRGEDLQHIETQQLPRLISTRMMPVGSWGTCPEDCWGCTHRAAQRPPLGAHEEGRPSEAQRCVEPVPGSGAQSASPAAEATEPPTPQGEPPAGTARAGPEAPAGGGAPLQKRTWGRARA